jgi:hypothetical protein
MAHRRTPTRCSCGADYSSFRTGLSFSIVRRMMYVSSDDPTTWRSKRRRGVLGYWRELKLSMYYSDHGACP